MSGLDDIGWGGYFEALFLEAAGSVDGAVAGRVVREDRGVYRVATADGELRGEVTGAFRHAHEGAGDAFPAVGDWVVAVPVPGEDKVLIHRVLTRRTAFTRTRPGRTSEVQVVAANVDVVFIVMGLDGDFNARRAERYIALGYESGARPVVVLSKADLVDDPAEYVSQIENVAIGVDVCAVSSIAGEGVDIVRGYLKPGETAACMGSSGAGKSTLINALLGEDVMDTGAVREDDSRGRHTTTHRQLIALPGGGAVIDTPGMRELQLTGDGEHFAEAFEDLEALIESCKFGDCGHTNEPGCAVREALESGDLDVGRWGSYQKLQKELDYAQRRQSEHFAHEEKKRGKEFNKMYREAMDKKKRF